MKNTMKIVCLLMSLVLAIGLLASASFAASNKNEYTKLVLTSAQLTVGHYNGTDLSGSIIQHCYNPNYAQEVTCLIDKDTKSAFWSLAYKFNDFKDKGGNLVPVILIDLTKDGQPTTVGALDMTLRDYFDCCPIHFEIQIATDAAGTNWVSVLDQNNIMWTSPVARFPFDNGNVDAYKMRILFYDIDEADVSQDTSKTDPLEGDETRFALAEIALYVHNGSTAPTTKPTEPTQKPTDPTEPKATEPKATEPETTEPETTEPETTEPETTEPETTEPEATDPEATDPEATEPEATEPEATEPEATEPEATEPENDGTQAPENDETQAPTNAPATNEDAKDEPKSNTGLIIGIVAAVVVLGVAVFFVIKKKK